MGFRVGSSHLYIRYAKIFEGVIYPDLNVPKLGMWFFHNNGNSNEINDVLWNCILRLYVQLFNFFKIWLPPFPIIFYSIPSIYMHTMLTIVTWLLRITLRCRQCITFASNSMNTSSTLMNSRHSKILPCLLNFRQVTDPLRTTYDHIRYIQHLSSSGDHNSNSD